MNIPVPQRLREAMKRHDFLTRGTADERAAHGEEVFEAMRLYRERAARSETSDARPAPRPSLKGYSLSITIEDGYYLKAYANPPAGGGIVSYGFQATISRPGVREALVTVIEEYLEDNGG